jgi:hypothetical protein
VTFWDISNSHPFTHEGKHRTRFLFKLIKKIRLMYAFRDKAVTLSKDT